MASLYDISQKDSQIQSVRSDLSVVQRNISEEQRKLSDANRQIADSVQRIAELYLPGFTKDAVTSVPDQLERTVAAFYEQKQARIDQLDELLDVSARYVTDLRRREIETASALTEGIDRRTGLEKRYDESLASNEPYQSARTLRAGLRLDADNAKAELEHRQLRKKEFQAPYLASSFFTHFLKNDDGTLAKDRTLWQKINYRFSQVYGFNERRAKFDMFDAEVWEVQQVADNIAQKLKAADVPVRDIEARVSSDLGLTAAKDQVVTLTESHDGAAKTLETATQEQTRYRDERRSLDVERGPHYQKAVDALVTELTGSSIDGLVDLARSTATQEDDELVKAIQAQNSEIKGFNATLGSLRSKESSISSDLASVQSARDALKRAYDDEQEEIARQRREEQRRRDEERRERERREEEDRRSSYSSSSSSSSFSSGSSFSGGGFSGGGSHAGGSF